MLFSVAVFSICALAVDLCLSAQGVEIHDAVVPDIMEHTKSSLNRVPFMSGTFLQLIIQVDVQSGIGLSCGFPEGLQFCFGGFHFADV
jgi:hypothetical protein